MTIRFHGWRALFLLAACPLSILAASSSHISLPGGGELRLTVPATWNQKFESPQKNMPAGVLLTPHDGASFNVLLTPLSGTPLAPAMTDENKLRTIVTVAARNALAKSVEMTIPVHDLTGSDVHGFYFFATDRAPPPGEWKYLTQGIVNIDAAPFAFSILTNDGGEATAKSALELIRNASYHTRTTV